MSFFIGIVVGVVGKIALDKYWPQIKAKYLTKK